MEREVGLDEGVEINECDTSNRLSSELLESARPPVKCILSKN